MYRRVGRIFLADGDALICRPEHMAEILRYIKEGISGGVRARYQLWLSGVHSGTKQEDLNMLNDQGLI